MNNKHELGLTLSRRIDRPTYSQLNPFLFFIDPNTSATGNPELKPQLTYSVELTHNIAQKFIFRYSYSRTSDNILMVLSPMQEQSKGVIQKPLNLAKYDYYGFGVSVPLNASKWFSSMNNLTAYYGLYNGDLANTNMNNGRPSFQFNSNNNFFMGGNWSAELSANYQSKSYYGFLDINPIIYFSAGVQKKIMDKKATLRLNITDPFYSNKVKATTALTGYQESFHQRRDSRVATVSFNYRFGTAQPSSRKNNGSAEDEKRRAG